MSKPADLVPAPTRAALRAAEGRVRALRGEGARVLWELGLVLREVDEQALWKAGGYPSFTAWLESREVDVARTTAERTLAVVQNFSLDLAMRYGFDKLYAGLRYLSVTQRAELPGDLIALDLRLRGPTGRYVTVPFHTATVRDVLDAIALEQARKTPGALPRGLEDDLSDRLERLSAALPDPPKGLRPADKRLQVTRTSTGELSLTFKQIPLAELDGFIAALQALKG